jgi:cysteine synthase A
MAHATSRPAVAQSTLDLIGNTPVVRLGRLAGPDHAEVWGKLESCNPGGSVKDRICREMLEAAERDGRLRPGGTIIEPTSGNTGIGLALVAAVKGYRLVLTMPETMSTERRSLLTAYGAELVVTQDSKGMHEAVRTAEEMLAEHPEYFMPQQFSNPANPEAHRRTTAQATTPATSTARMPYMGPCWKARLEIQAGNPTSRASMPRVCRAMTAPSRMANTSRVKPPWGRAAGRFMRPG